MAEADALDAALLLNDLLRLARPALGEGQLRLFGLMVGHALGAPPAALAGVDDEEGTMCYIVRRFRLSSLMRAGMPPERVVISSGLLRLSMHAVMRFTRLQ